MRQDVRQAPFSGDILTDSTMATKSITGTDAARNLSDVLNQVRYQGAQFDVVRGKEVVACIVPNIATHGVPFSQLNALVRAWPRLGRARLRPSPKISSEVSRTSALMSWNGIDGGHRRLDSARAKPGTLASPHTSASASLNLR